MLDLQFSGYNILLSGYLFPYSNVNNEMIKRFRFRKENFRLTKDKKKDFRIVQNLL